MGATVLSTNIQVSNDKQWIHIQSTDSFHIEFLGRSKLHLQSSNSSLFHTATSDNDLCFRAFHQVAIVQKYQGSKGRVGWIASVMETWIVMDSVWLPRLPCMTSWQCLKWLLLESDPTWKKIISYSWGTCHRVPKQPDQVEDKLLHLPPRWFIGQTHVPLRVPRSVTCVATSSRSWSAPTRTTLASWISVVLFIWGNARILPTYSKFVDITWLDLEKHWNYTFLPTFHPH